MLKGVSMKSGTLTVSMFQREDAEGVGRLFREIYGDGYPAKIVYNPDQLIDAFEKMDQIPIVVKTPENRIVGYSSLYRVAPDRGVYEKGNGAVSADYRNAGVMGMIFRYVKGIIPKIDDMNMFFGEPVCNFVYIQKAAAATLPMVETALEIDLMPADAYEKEKSSPGRVSTLLMFMTVTPRPHNVYIPPVYAEQLGFIYKGLDDRRTVIKSGERVPVTSRTCIKTEVFEAPQVARMAIHEAGEDFRTIFAAEEESAVSRGVVVIQVWLKLSWPWIGEIVDTLKWRGYFLGGVLPQWFGDDGLLMQKLLVQPNWEGIHLFSDRANSILEFIRADWQFM